MNSEIFMQWVEDKLIPRFENKYPGCEIVLGTDNALYHHKRGIGSLSSFNKKKRVQMMVGYNMEWLDIPLVSDERIDF